MFRNRQAGVTTLTLDITDEQTISDQLAEVLGKAPQDFFAGMPFVADINKAPCTRTELLRLKTLFLEHGLTLIGITNHRCETAELVGASLADIQLSQPGDRKANRIPSESKPASNTPANAEAASQPQEQETSHAMVIRQHVRSGQRIYAKGQDLIVIGTVGAGAEIIADGHISVYGALRGRAFAGVKGDQQCFIFCSELAAELISIAGCYQTMEQFEIYKGQKNCLITLNSDTRMQVRSLMA